MAVRSAQESGLSVFLRSVEPWVNDWLTDFQAQAAFDGQYFGLLHHCAHCSPASLSASVCVSLSLLMTKI